MTENIVDKNVSFHVKAQFSETGHVTLAWSDDVINYITPPLTIVVVQTFSPI